MNRSMPLSSTYASKAKLYVSHVGVPCNDFDELLRLLMDVKLARAVWARAIEDLELHCSTEGMQEPACWLCRKDVLCASA
jgi:hypothetical protein